MGLIYSTESNNNNNDQILLLKRKVQEQTDLIQLLKNEVDSLRNMYDNNASVDTKVLSEIDKVWNDHSYEYLVLSGGGVKGISFTGALETLQKLNIIYSTTNEFKLKGIAGASAGSIIASLLAIGYTPTELIDIMSNLDFERIADDKLGYIRDTLNFIENWGVCPGNYIQDFLADLIEKKTGNKDYTLVDLMNDKNVKLVIVTTDVSNQKSVYLYPGNPIDAYSNIPIRKAVRMSIGVQGVFEPYEYNNCYFVDGGTLDNYPLHVFDGEYPGDQKARLNLCPPNPKVLGLKLMTSNDQINYNITEKIEIDGLFEYVAANINMFLTENDRRIMTPSFWIRTIIIITPNYPLTKFNINDQEKQLLINAGRKYTNEFFLMENSKALKKIN